MNDERPISLRLPLPLPLATFASDTASAVAASNGPSRSYRAAAAAPARAMRLMRTRSADIGQPARIALCCLCLCVSAFILLAAGQYRELTTAAAATTSSTTTAVHWPIYCIQLVQAAICLAVVGAGSYCRSWLCPSDYRSGGQLGEKQTTRTLRAGLMGAVWLPAAAAACVSASGLRLRRSLSAHERERESSSLRAAHSVAILFGLTQAGHYCDCHY